MLHIQGLAHTVRDAQGLWYQFRNASLPTTDQLINKVEQVATPQSALPATQGTGDAQGTAAQAQQASTANKALDGLKKFKDFVAASTDIEKAVITWSPMVAEAFKGALELLGQIHF